MPPRSRRRQRLVKPYDAAAKILFDLDPAALLLIGGLRLNGPVRVVDTGQSGLFGFTREAPTGTLLGLFNLTEHWLNLPESVARSHGITQMYDALSDARVTAHLGQIALPPYARVWLT